MRDERKKLADWFLPLLLATTVVLLPVFYALSIGPAIYLNSHGYFASATEVYAPLIYVATQSPTLARMLEWYMDLWQ